MIKIRNVLLIGYGSIGKKHAKNLIDIKINPCILTQHSNNSKFIFLKNISEIKNNKIDYCIISSPTARHLKDLKKVLTMNNIPRKILIEKPLDYSYENGDQIKKIGKKYKIIIYVAYNLRFLSAFNIIREFIKERKTRIRIVEIVAGQNLEEWRPKMDYTKSYSANRSLGGGVDLDLSHEVDYALWLFGKNFKDSTILKNKISNLKINSPDFFKLILNYNKFIVDVTLDYIRRPKTRYIKIICENGANLFYDFINNTMTIGKKTTVLKDNLNESYKKMLNAFFEIEKDDKTKLCTVEEGLEILKIIKV